MVLSVAALACACSDWTETESVDIKYADIKTDNPGLYAKYSQSLRDYRDSEHKVVIAKFDNKTTAPAGQSEHINALPDSVDYVILTNPDNLPEAIQLEMNEVREYKGMKVLYEISYSSIVTAYNAYAEEWTAAHPTAEGTEEGSGETPTDPADTLISQNNYVRAAVEEQILLYNKYGYDGISVNFTSVNPLIYTDATKPTLEAQQEAFLGPLNEWKESHEDALVFFEGTPHYIVTEDLTVVSEAAYYILDAVSCANSSELSYLVNQALRFDNLASDRMIVKVTTTSLTDPNETDGTFNEKDDEGNTLTAITGASYWVAATTSGYVKAGLCIEKAQNDYFNIQNSYSNIRKAIAIMNPSPTK